MRAVCVDDEELVKDLAVSMCEELPILDEVKGFVRADEALDWINGNGADVAILDIDMPDMNGIELAAKIKEKHPGTAILFLTGHTRYALDAFAIHASGYILKPISRERLALEIEYALSGRKGQERERSHVEAKTFGEFDLFIDGMPVTFPRSKAKELLAYLIDRQGASVSRKNVFAVLWEDGLYDRSKQKYLDVIIRCLRDTLSEKGAGDILEVRKGTLRICPEKIDCDVYRFFAGEAEAVNSYRGEYMSSYSWASMSEAYMDRMKST